MNSYPNETFETETLFLRRMTVGDAETEFEMFGNPEYTWFLGRTYTLEEIQKGIQWQIDKKIYENGFGKWVIIFKENNEMAGSFAIGKVKNKEEIEIAYFLRTKYWGKGIGTIAAKIMLNYGFNHLNLQEIIIRVHPMNTASINIANKLKMNFTGVKKYPDEYPNEIAILNVYSMTIDDYKTLYPEQ
jgi:RimJ/RimL family protein N-acetyltransferase